MLFLTIMNEIISEFKQIEQNWQALSFLLNPARSEVDYQRQVTMLDALIDEIGEDEQHPLAGLMENLGMLIHSYETEHYPIPVAPARETLVFLMEEHHLTQNDLREIGTQGVVSEILNGKRKLNLRQIRLLSQRFHVSPEVFI